MRGIYRFHCLYCSHVFEQKVIKVESIKKTPNGRGYANQVQCPRCKNFLKNNEGVFIRELKDEKPNS